MVIFGLQMMAVGKVRMIVRLGVMPLFVRFRSRVVVVGGALVMVGGLLVMFVKGNG